MQQLSQEYSIEVKYRHFPLHPDTPEDGLTLEELFADRAVDITAAQVRMKQLMAEEGLAYGQRTMTFNSRLAQELAAWAETQPEGDGIHQVLFRAYFVDNMNLARIPNLLRLADEVGVSVEEARSVLESRQYREQVDADWQRSRELGISGVPTFVIGNQALVGAQPYEQLKQFAIAAGAEMR